MTNVPMGDLLRYHAKRKAPDAPALIYRNATVSWSQLDAQANKLARKLCKLGVQKDDIVVLALDNGPALHAFSFACWKVGATPAPLSAKMPEPEFAVLVDLMRPRLSVSDAPAFVENERFPVITSTEDLSAYDDAPFPSIIGAHWKAACSGGSTGRPKAIIIDSPSSFDPHSKDVIDIHKMRPDGVVLNPGPLYHNAPFLFTHLAMFTGSTVIGMERFDAEEALALIEKHRVNWVHFVPAMMHRIWSLPAETRDKYDLSSLDAVWHLAAPCASWLKEAWINWLGAERLWERYGGTEGFGSTVIRGDEWLSRRGSVGRVLGKTKLKIVNDVGLPCETGKIGEIYFYPPGGRPPSYYIGAKLARDADGFLTLGDLGYQDEDGYLFLADRRVDLIVRGGANIYPAEIEGAIIEHPDVASVIVVGLPCDELGARVHAIIEAKQGIMLDLASVHRFLMSGLTKTKLPESYDIVVQSLRDDTGKARRSALRSERVAWIAQRHEFRIWARELKRTG